MHSAPSVSYPVGRSRFAAGLLVILWLLGAATTAMGWAQAQAPGWRWGAAAVLLVAVGVLAAWSWWREPSAILSWDGENWRWPAAGAGDTAVPQVVLDLQRWMLLRRAGGSGTNWLWLERARRPASWDDVRRAVYSRARPQAPPGAGHPAAKT
jgi:toxin CptA